MKPLFHVVETLKIGDVVHHDDSMGATVVTGSDCSKSFLTRSIPLTTSTTSHHILLTLELQYSISALQFVASPSFHRGQLFEFSRITITRAK